MLLKNIWPLSKHLKSYFDLIFRDEQKKQQCSCSTEAGLHQTEERPGTSVILLVSPPSVELFSNLAGALHRCWASPLQPARMALCGQVENTILFMLPSGILICLWRNTEEHILLSSGVLRTFYTKVECITESWSSPQARDRCKIYWNEWNFPLRISLQAAFNIYDNSKWQVKVNERFEIFLWANI